MFLRKVNQKTINIFSLINFEKMVKENKNNSFYMSFHTTKKELEKLNLDENEIKDILKNKEKVVSINAEIKCVGEENLKELMENFYNFFECPLENRNCYILTYSSSRHIENGYEIRININNCVKSRSYNYLTVGGFDNLTIENLETNIKSFMSNKNKKELDVSDFKNLKTYYYYNTNDKNFSNFVENLEQNNVINVERTPSLMIKKIILKDEKETTVNYNNFLSLKSNGKLKDITPRHFKENEKNLYILELYSINLLKHLKTNLILENDVWYLELNYFVLKYAKDVMQDVSGKIWTSFKESLNETLKEKLIIVEKYLNIEITNKEDIFPLKYIEGNNGEAIFKTKEIKFNIIN